MESFIEIRGARENNLKDVSLRIPKRKITIFTGVSGSGKSSIVFDTIATEAQRQLYENFSLFVRNFLPKYPQPEADAIENLSMAVDRGPEAARRRLALHGRHDHRHLHLAAVAVLARRASRRAGFSNVFSFNDPQGMCPECNGLGRKLGVICRRFPRPVEVARRRARCRCRSSRRGRSAPTPRPASSTSDKKLSKFTRDEMDLLLHGKPQKVQDALRRQHHEHDLHGHRREDRALLHQARSQDAVGADAEGGGAVPEASGLSDVQGRAAEPGGARCKIKGRNIAELSAMEIGELIPVIREINGPVAAPMVDTLAERLAAPGRHRTRIPDA